MAHPKDMIIKWLLHEIDEELNYCIDKHFSLIETQQYLHEAFKDVTHYSLKLKYYPYKHKNMQEVRFNKKNNHS